MTTAELCFALARENGTSGDERAAKTTVQNLFAPYIHLEEDALGSLRGSCGCGKTRILLDAHLDRIGLVVTEIDEDGFLHVGKVGGVDARVLVGSEVIVYGTSPVYGVISSTPPHLQKDEQKKDGVSLDSLTVDVGMTGEEAAACISVGDRISFVPQQCVLQGTRISSAGFDDRCGVAAILRAVELVHDQLQNVTLCVQLSVQEEVTGSGARTGAYAFAPDYAIAVDVGFGDDPFCEPHETIALGKGPSIGLSPVLDRGMAEALKRLAKENGIPFQHDVMSGRTGTNADQINITRGGVRTALLSIPERSMHTAVEVIDTEDVDNTAKLLAAFILWKEASCND